MDTHMLRLAIDRYRRGDRLATIAGEIGVPVATLATALRRAGVPSRAAGVRARALGELPRLAAQGMTRAELATRYGVCTDTITRWADVAGVAIQARTEPLDDKTIAAYFAGATLRELAAELGVHPTTVARRLFTHAGVPRRPRTQPTYPSAGVPPPRRAKPTCPVCGGPASSRDVRRCRKCKRNPIPPRVCALDGCDVVFTPSAGKVARGAGRYHSLQCAYAARRGTAPPQLEQWNRRGPRR
jgi:transposase-like protein